MRIVIAGLLIFVTGSVFAQPTVTDQFKAINTVEQANDWAKANAALKPEVFKLSVNKDSSLIDKRLLRQNKGDVFSVGYTTYKVVDANQSIQFRASYIFLDGGSLSASEVDSLKKIITAKIASGANWDQLSDQYTMDGNKTHGDTGWFFGPETVPAELQDAIKNHKLGDVFAVDVTDKQWHYIVKKTYDDNFKKEITVLKANGR